MAGVQKAIPAPARSSEHAAAIAVSAVAQSSTVWLAVKPRTESAHHKMAIQSLPVEDVDLNIKTKHVLEAFSGHVVVLPVTVGVVWTTVDLGIAILTLGNATPAFTAA